MDEEKNLCYFCTPLWWSPLRLHKTFWSIRKKCYNNFFKLIIVSATFRKKDIKIVMVSWTPKFCAKIQNCFFKVKFGTWIPSNVKNSMMIFTSAFGQKYVFWVNLVQKIKSGQFKLVPRLIRVSRVQWCWSLFQFPTCKFCPENPFGILILLGKSLSSLLAETWSQWPFLF